MVLIGIPTCNKAAIATALVICFLIHPALIVSATTTVRGDDRIKSESQFRSEASRYDTAIRAIADAASMKLEDQNELKRALAILNREGPNVKYLASKLVVLGLNDSTFTASVKKACPDKATAEAFTKELRANPKAILKISAARSLITRLRQNAEADAGTLQRLAKRLKAAAVKDGRSDNGNLVGEVIHIAGDFEAFIFLVVYFALADSLAATGEAWGDILAPIVLFQECLEDAIKKQSECATTARNQPVSNLTAEAFCFSNWSVQEAECLIAALTK